MEPTRPITIGVLSERTGVGIETIRHYERMGILPKPARTRGGHRVEGA
jgi:MerR family transcriptional regulator, mercuric resistance operon regulatory protein